MKMEALPRVERVEGGLVFAQGFEGVSGPGDQPREEQDQKGCAESAIHGHPSYTWREGAGL